MKYQKYKLRAKEFRAIRINYKIILLNAFKTVQICLIKST